MLYTGLFLQGVIMTQLVMVEQSIFLIKIQKEILYTMYPELKIRYNENLTEE